VDGVARFPDAPTTRGARHVRELTEAKKQGYRSVIVLLIQGVGATRFRPNWETDPDFRDAFVEALDEGVETYARVLRFRGKRIYLGESLPVGRE
ncbi:MAG: DNA/RNA nuclease SfsA, partial [Candidatus Omnitrophica bacterium]|nr:DNA/RNA nuclease SfsA [Candidatus Omnitrophota bacterium]